MRNKLLFVAIFSSLLVGQLFAQSVGPKKKVAPKKTVVTANKKAPKLYQVIEPEIISTTDEVQDNQTTTENLPTEIPTPIAPPKVSTLKKLETLEQKVDALTTKMSSIESQQKALLDLEILSRAEQRADSLRKSFLDMTEKEATLQARLGQIEIDIQPGSLERATSTTGSLRPEDLRDQRRKSLENERTSVRTQLEQVLIAKLKLQSAVENADRLVDKFRAKMEKELDDEKKDDGELKSNDN